MSQDKIQYADEPDKPDFISELTGLINKYSMENASDTPDFLLASYLVTCLNAYGKATKKRDDWYGFKP